MIDWVMRAEGVSLRHAVELLREDLPPLAAAPIRPVKLSTVPKLPQLLERDAEDEQLLRQVVRFYRMEDGLQPAEKASALSSANRVRRHLQ